MFFKTNKDVVHPFHFPTQVLLVDDDPSYLKNFVLSVPIDAPFYLFTSPLDALKYLQHYDHAPLSSFSLSYECRHIAAVGPQAFSLNYAKVKQELTLKRRFNEIGIAVVDYAMPEMDGVSLCKYFNCHIKRMILTGMADQPRAVDAFNKGIIHKYLMKHDSKATETVAYGIVDFQREYFSTASHRVNGYLGATHALNDKAFVDYFKYVIGYYQIIEHYLIYPGQILGIDAVGNTYLLVIENENSLKHHYLTAKQKSAPKALLEQLDSREVVPYFPTHDFHYDTSISSSWEEHIYSHQLLKSDMATYFCTVIPSPWLPGFDSSSIYSYAQFKQEHPLGFVH